MRVRNSIYKQIGVMKRGEGPGQDVGQVHGSSSGGDECNG